MAAVKRVNLIADNGDSSTLTLTKWTSATAVGRRLTMAKSYGGVRYSHAEPSQDFKDFRAYSHDWEKTYFDHETGGYVVTHRDRIESGNSSPNEKEKFNKEQDMCKDLAAAGHHIEHLSDKDRPKRHTYDIHMDGVRADLKSASSANNIEKYTRKAVKEQGAKVVVIRIENNANVPKVMAALRSAKRKYRCRVIYYFQSDKKIREV